MMLRFQRGGKLLLCGIRNRERNQRGWAPYWLSALSSSRGDFVGNSGGSTMGSTRAYMRSVHNRVLPLRTCSSSHLLDLQTLRRRKQRSLSLWTVRRRLAPSVYADEHVPRRRPTRFVSFQQEPYRLFGNSTTDTDKKKDTTTTPISTTQAGSSSSSAVSSDPPVWTWVDRILPTRWQPYARLARLDKPIGTMLLVRNVLYYGG